MMTPSTPQPWTGRVDGPGFEHRRWHQVVNAPDSGGTELALIGFCCDEGVRRNRGRTGAAAGPASIRAALASMAVSTTFAAHDRGDLSVDGEYLEEAQAALGVAVREALDAGHLPIVLGGGHETAYGTSLGLRANALARGARVGILNLDAHFDLRADERASSGTVFRQIADEERAAGREFRYAVVGISQPGNTATLFDAANTYGVRYLLDEQCREHRLEEVLSFVREFAASVDVLHLTIDLDVLPAETAPGVSAPSSLGVPLSVLLEVCRDVSRLPQLALVDVVELNPAFDIDQRTARAAARLIHTLATGRATR